jgi:hypothetical protein
VDVVPSNDTCRDECRSVLKALVHGLGSSSNLQHVHSLAVGREPVYAVQHPPNSGKPFLSL